jgi:hypothetical protein
MTQEMNETSEPICELKIDKDTKEKLDKNFRLFFGKILVPFFIS